MAKWGSLIPALGTGLLIVFLAGCEEKGPAQRAGEKIDETVEKAGDEVGKVGEKVGETIRQAGETLEKATD